MGFLSNIGAGLIWDVVKDTTADLAEGLHAKAVENVQEAIATDKNGDDVIAGLFLAGSALLASIASSDATEEPTTTE